MIPFPQEKPKVFAEFLEFLKEYNIIALAVAFVMGSASTALVNSLVKDLVMPLLSPLLAGGAWKEATFNIGAVTVSYGSFLAELINFLILSIVVFIIVKMLLKKAKAEANA